MGFCVSGQYFGLVEQRTKCNENIFVTISIIYDGPVRLVGTQTFIMEFVGNYLVLIFRENNLTI